MLFFLFKLRFVVAVKLGFAVALIVGGFACVGQVTPSGEKTLDSGSGSSSGGGLGGGSGTGGGTGGMPMVAAPPSALPAENKCSTAGRPGPRALRRLSAKEFVATIRTLFGDQITQAAPIVTVFSDPSVLGFSVDADALLVQSLNASQLMDNAEAVAGWAVTGGHLTSFATCTTHDATCGQQLVKAFAQVAFRTRLADSDPRLAPYVALFMAESSYSDGAQAVVSAVLQSPYFLYRTELGAPSATGGALFDLTPYEIGSGLSYLLTGTMPDADLMSAADQVVAGNLTTTAMIDQQAQRLLTSGGASSQFAVTGFMTGWLGLDRLYTTAKDDTVFKLTQALRDEMATETRSLISETFNSGGGMRELLVADHTFLNSELAQFYGLPTTNLSTAFVSVPLTGSTVRDGGILAHGSVLIGYSRPDISSPTQRGHMVRSRMLCQDVAPPPPGLDTKFKLAVAAKTTRQHYEDEHSVGGCAQCHQFMDKIGFGFERYDGFGRRRDAENGVAIDDSGTVLAMDMATGGQTFQGLGGLESYLAGNADVGSCLVRYWSYYAYASSSWAQDACTYTAIRDEAAQGGFGLRAVLNGIIHASHFTHRVQDQ